MGHDERTALVNRGHLDDSYKTLSSYSEFKEPKIQISKAEFIYIYYVAMRIWEDN